MSSEIKINQIEEEERRDPKQTSILFDQYVIWGVLALLIGALWFKIVSLVIISSLLLAISLIIRIWKHNSLKQLIPTVEIQKTRVFPEDLVTLQCTLSNEKWLPLVWVEWEHPKQEGWSWTEGDPDQYRLRLLWLWGFQHAKWEMSGKASKRGIYSLGSILVRSGDAFRFAEQEKGVELNKELYVYPKLLSVSVPALRSVFQWGIGGKSGGLLEDPSHIAGIREYQNGDEWRKIHWQASARTGTLQTWVYKPILPKQLLILTDVKGFWNVANREFEWFLSVIASVAMNYHRQGIQIGHVSNSMDYKGMKIRDLVPTQTVGMFLDDLAKMTSTTVPSKHLLIEEVTRKKDNAAPIFYFCDQILESHVAWVKQNGKASSRVIFYYRQRSTFSDQLQGQTFPMDTLLSTSKIQGGTG